MKLRCPCESDGKIDQGFGIIGADSSALPRKRCERQQRLGQLVGIEQICETTPYDKVRGDETFRVILGEIFSSQVHRNTHWRSASVIISIACPHLAPEYYFL